MAKVRRRMERRQSYLTASRMQRRRSWLESKLGKRQDFDRKEESAKTAAPISTSATPEPGYVVELQLLPQLRDQGIVSEEEFAAKKKHLLRI